MTNEIIKDIGDIYTRLFDHRPFLRGESRFFVREFEELRGDREVENLFSAIQKTTELRSDTYPRCQTASENYLPRFKDNLDQALANCEAILSKEKDETLEATLDKNRETRKKLWQVFIDDMTHKCSRIDHTFEEKEEELCEFYSDLTQKLHIHK